MALSDSEKRMAARLRGEDAPEKRKRAPDLDRFLLDRGKYQEVILDDKPANAKSDKPPVRDDELTEDDIDKIMRNPVFAGQSMSNRELTLKARALKKFESIRAHDRRRK